MKYLLLLFTLVSFTLHSETYHFASINYLTEQEVGRIVLTEVYQQLGINIVITPLPGKRAQHTTAKGSNDGEIMRIYSYGYETHSTTRVPTPYYFLETMVFTKKGSSIKINNPSDLAKYQVVKVRGVKHTENITRGFENVTDTDNTAQMFKLVQAGLADIAITNRMDGLVVLKSLGITNIVAHKKSLDRLPLYHYIRKDHVKLIKRVNDKLQELSQNGGLDEIISRAEHEVFTRKLSTDH
ncbi:transporter substrate-binding domain-containing protein [Pseudoalteromonas sp. JBTF-M23]|uniref:Transporter substrate-binding domain-containing protein n=1 Tax=Pseudoalteromonas caenipelagi TaxID=2726988 RepID=A0A849V903_9GAMM|nr:transporter substrate-binding domain-containing protein [Pseudoalteromonas caenipelagi]NOU49113.1 transporter substrate-binding domain-containing protein [Pseudoalteromonas caenipelagi]